MALHPGFSMSEFELKFQVPEEALPSLQLELVRHGAHSERVLARYFDTTDGLLARHGVSLRLRKEGRRWVQTLKARGDSVVRRLEHNVTVRVPSGTQPVLDAGRHDGEEAGSQLRGLLDQAEWPSLEERFTIEVWRRSCDLQMPGALVEASLDRGTIRAGTRSAPICELELELKSGDPRSLFVLAKAWSAHGGLWLDTRSKSERGAALCGASSDPPSLKTATPKLDAEMSGEALVRAVIRSTLDPLLVHAAEVAAGSRDEEQIHQLRVGLRRLLTALRELAPIARGVEPGWTVPLSEAFTRLGIVRDNESVARVVRPLLARAGAPKLEWTKSSVKVDPGEVVRGAQFQAVLIDLLGYVHESEADVAPIPHASALAHIRHRLSRLHKRATRGGDRFENLSLEKQHTVRKRLKRLRYLADFFEPLWPGSTTRRYLARLGPAQQALGTHNDIAVAMMNFRRDAELDPQALFAAGYLQAYLATTARASRLAMKRVAKAAAFWRR